MLTPIRRFALPGLVLLTAAALTAAEPAASKAPGNPNTAAPHPVRNPTSRLMLQAPWVPSDPHQIDFSRLPRVPVQHIVVSDVRARQGVNQHNYLIHHDGRFWAMWSDGPEIEDRVGQVVKYATSRDGVTWTEPKLMTGNPRGFGPDSPIYNTRKAQGFRYISRGFWVRENQLLALASLDEAAGFFGPSLELRAFRWNGATEKWDDIGVVQKNAINNFPPQRLPSGEWAMSRRKYDYDVSGVEFLIGGVKALDQWTSVPVVRGAGGDVALKAEEPIWWTLPDGNLMALFRDNGPSRYLFRAFSADQGRTWSRPVQTDFPDARSKLHGLRLKDGRYVLVSNANPKKRDPLTLAISRDGMVFDRLFYLVGGRHVDYPHVMEHEGYLYIAHSGGKRSVEIQRVRIADLDTLTMPASVQ
ncbi:MAG: exo-alpha-sialidase [Opitutaceae bacterium]|nr:exo-alpha-sialidase [Opitutaceae bacterium]